METEVNKLLEALKTNPTFQAFTEEKKEVFARLADNFYENDFALHLTPEELSAKLRIGSKQNWYEFLTMEPVRQYINTQMAFMAQVASRKTFQKLVSEGLEGDTQAIKQVYDISGVLNTGDKNKVIVMHQIARPKVIKAQDS